LLVKAEGDFSVSIKGSDPLCEVLGRASLLHGLSEFCWMDLVEDALDVIGENSRP